MPASRRRLTPVQEDWLKSLIVLLLTAAILLIIGRLLLGPKFWQALSAMAYLIAT